MEWDEIMDKLIQNRNMLSNEEEEMIRTIAKRFLLKNGGLAEWSIASVLKTELRETVTGVRIPEPPQRRTERFSFFFLDK